MVCRYPTARYGQGEYSPQDMFRHLVNALSATTVLSSHESLTACLGNEHLENSKQDASRRTKLSWSDVKFHPIDVVRSPHTDSPTAPLANARSVSCPDLSTNEEELELFQDQEP